MTAPDDQRAGGGPPDATAGAQDDTETHLELMRAVAGFRAVLAANGCVGLPSLADFLD